MKRACPKLYKNKISLHNDPSLVRKSNSSKIYPFLFLTFLLISGSISTSLAQFTPGRIVVVQTSGSTSKGSSNVVLQEYATNGTAGVAVSIPATGATPLQMAAGPGGSEGFLTRSTDGTFLVLGGYSTTAAFTDITSTPGTTAPRVLFKVDAAGTPTQVASSTTSYSANDIRGGISDGTNFWASGASNATDGINYFAPGTPAALAVTAKAYGLQIFNNQIYYSTQKAGPANTTSQLGIFTLGAGLPTSGSITPTQIINMGTTIPADFSFNAAMNVCYIAVNLNSSIGGIQKWTYNGTAWSLAYTLGTGATNIGAYGLVVDYSGTNPVLYATTFESNTVGNRVIKITDDGTSSSGVGLSTATTLATAPANNWFHGIAFSPSCPIPAQPSAFTVSAANVNPGQQAVTYTVPNDPAATSYVWNYTGNGATVNGTGNSVTVDFSSTSTAGNLTVAATNACGTSSTRSTAVGINGAIRITEFMYNAGGAGNIGEFVEFTNVGGAAVDMTGWSYDDNSRTSGSQSLSAFGTVQPGESVILTEIAAATFRTNWNLCAGIKVIGNCTQNLGREDEINLYDASSTLIDRLTYGDQTFSPGSIRTTLKSGWASATGVGANTITQWTLASVGDAEASYTSTTTPQTEIGNPGKSNRATVAFDPCFVPNNTPTIVFDITNTSNYLDGGLSLAPSSPFTVSGVLSDPTDPASNLGIYFIVNDAETAATSLTVTATSSNTSIVPNANLSLTGTGASRNLKISPSTIGYANITITVSDGTLSATYVLNYAASIASATPSTTTWHTGMSDASDGMVLDNDYYISGDDELDVLNVYSRNSSGLPVKSYDYTSQLGLDPVKPEVDLEGGTRSTVSPDKIYWIGSLSNSKAPFDDRPNRNRIFATTVTGAGSATSFSFSGYYNNLRSKIIAWGDANGYNFTASAAAGVDSKSPSGFAVEGLVFGPDNTTLYIAMRAPMVPTANRTKAVIVPLTNFESWFGAGSPSANPTFGAPIELDLGGRGFRDLIRLSNGTYVIIAGNSAGSPLTSAIYKWSGYASDAPIRVSSSADGLLNLEGVMPVIENGKLSMTKLQLITDGGDEELYNDGNVAKDFNELSLRKFRSDIVSSLDLCLPIAGDTTATVCNSFTWYGTSYTTSSTPTHTFVNALGCDSVVTLHLTIQESPSISASSPAQNLCAGDALSLSVTASGTNLTYQWKKGATNINNATSASFSVTGVSASDADSYTCVVSGTCAPPATSTASVVTVSTPPTISASSPAQNLCAGDAMALSVTATGTNLTYQWKKGTADINNATGASFSLTGVSASDAGSYTCVVTGTCAPTATSTASVLTVSAPPTIDAGANQSLCSNVTSVTLLGVVTNTSGQIWSTSGLGTFGATGSALAATYTPSPADLTNGSVTLTLTSSNSGVCTAAVSDAVTISFHTCTEVLEQSALTEIQLIPNPNAGNLTVQLSERYQASSVTIYNVQGEKLREQKVEAGATELNLEVSDLKAGVYMLVLKDNEGKQLVRRMIRN